MATSNRLSVARRSALTLTFTRFFTCAFLLLVQVTPRSLYVLIAMLLATGTIPLEALLQHVSPGVVSLAAKER